MPIFEYQAKTVDGKLKKGRIDADSEGAVVASLRQDSFYPITIKEYKKSQNIDLSDYKKVTIKDIAIFCRQFAFINAAGITILRALEIVKAQTENSKLKKILNDVYEEVQKGVTLSTSIGKHKEIPKMLVNMMEVGETSGTLDKVMIKMADYYDNEFKQNQKVKQAMTYPVLVCIFAIIVVNFLVIKVLPTFTGVLTANGSTNLPMPTKIVLGLSGFMQAKWPIVVLVIILIIIAIKYYGRSGDGSAKLDRIKLKTPVFGIYNKKVFTARFARTFGTLMASGVPLIQSIDICSNVVGNSLVKKTLQESKDSVRKGEPMSDTLEKSSLFPPMLTQMMKIGEESGTLDSIMEKTAEFYDGEVETATAQMTAMLEPIIIIVLAFVVGFIVLSIILPMFQMYDTM